MSDEQDARALGCAGHAWVHTPHLDALAARGTRFTNAFTPSPIYVPARESLAADVLRGWLDPVAVDGRAKADQNALVDRFGGRERALGTGLPGATPIPAC